MAHPFPEDWIAKERELKDANSAKRAALIGPVAWLAREAVGRRCTLEQAAEAVEEGMETFGPQKITVLGYLQFVEHTRELLEEHLRDTTQSGSVDQAGGEEDPAP